MSYETYKCGKCDNWFHIDHERSWNFRRKDSFLQYLCDGCLIEFMELIKKICEMDIVSIDGEDIRRIRVFYEEMKLGALYMKDRAYGLFPIKDIEWEDYSGE